MEDNNLTPTFIIHETTTTMLKMNERTGTSTKNTLFASNVTATTTTTPIMTGTPIINALSAPTHNLDSAFKIRIHQRLLLTGFQSNVITNEGSWFDLEPSSCDERSPEG